MAFATLGPGGSRLTYPAFLFFTQQVPLGAGCFQMPLGVPPQVPFESHQPASVFFANACRRERQQQRAGQNQVGGRLDVIKPTHDFVRKLIIFAATQAMNKKVAQK